jgi:arginyl-tRNA synthetase
MKTITQLQNIVTKSLDSLGLSYVPSEIILDHPQSTDFGDYSTNIALIKAKEQKVNPKELAEKIKATIEQQDDIEEIIDKIETAGPGFVNFYLKTDYLKNIAESINYDDNFRSSLASWGQGKTMVIDYSAPNIAKPFGIGHLRSTNIGQAVYNIYRILGWNTIGDNHVGDWGTQFGKMIVAIDKYENKDIRFQISDFGKTINEFTVEDLEKLYVAFHKAEENDEKLVDEARETFAKLEKGDPKTREMWQKCVDISWQDFDRVYQMLGVHIDFALGESFYENLMPDVIKEMKAKGIVKSSQGAEIVEFDDMPPAMVKKSNDTTTYFTRDIATIKYRMERWKPELIVYEVGSDHILHFKQVFEAAKMMGWEPTMGFVHIAHGMIRWKTGKFSTREGKTIHLDEVIDKAMKEARTIAEKSKVSKEMKASEKEEMIAAVAIGGIKFNDLSSDPRKDIIFDWDKIMSLEGDSGPYIQYTYSRCMSVLDKTKIREHNNIETFGANATAEELELLKELTKFEEKIIEAAQRFSPSVIAEYLLGVARKYNEFYAKHKIVGSEDEVRRVFLTRTTASLLSTGLGLLGIKTVAKM